MTLWLNDSLRTRAGALVPVAERFLHGWLGDDAVAYGGGARGLVMLCDHMERWLGLDGVDDEGERSFVEGAGALLGLLLIDHVGDGAHAARGSAHRLRLGQHGYFDPFAAVDRALDAPNPRKELARQVSLAEAEAAARGPISRVVGTLLTTLERERPDLALTDHFDTSLSLRMVENDEPLEIDLTRAVESTRDQGIEAVQNVVRKLLAMLPGAREDGVDFAEVRARIVPRLARSEALLELAGAGSALRAGLFATKLTSELSIALLVEYEGRARYLRSSELETWGVSPNEALSVALENLSARSEHARVARTETEHGPLWVARTGDGRDSARVLLKSLCGALSATIGVGPGERVFVSIPHRDTFFACAGGHAALLHEMARRTAHDAERAPHRLSTRVFELRESGLIE